jgi:hypothetical protein
MGFIGHLSWLTWALLVTGSAASLAANVAVAEPTMTGRVIAAWSSFSLIAAYELLMRQVRRAADGAASDRPARRSRGREPQAAIASGSERMSKSGTVTPDRRAAGRDVQREAWRWARDNRAEDGSLPSGRAIGSRYGRHERWADGQEIRRCRRDWDVSQAGTFRA